MDIVGKKYIYFIISLIIIIPGLVSLVLFGFKPAIDFTGGSRVTIQSEEFKSQNSKDQVINIAKDNDIEISAIQPTGVNSYILRTKPLDQKKNQQLLNALKKDFPDLKETSYETVGPTVGSETTADAIKAVLMASVLIVLYIAWSFRKVPKPASSFRFGICAVLALLHDVLVLLGVFSIYYFFGVEVDALFVTATLTVIGFSVHDTIVVFDRIRENLLRNPGESFAKVTNDSILQTLGRSINTSLTVVLVLFTLLLFGGENTKWFIVALLVGVISGTYSSIFNAAPLLVVWQDWINKRHK